MPQSNIFTIMDDLFLVWNIKEKIPAACIQLKDYQRDQIVNKVKNLNSQQLKDYEILFNKFIHRYGSQLRNSKMVEFLEKHDFKIRFDDVRNEYIIDIDKQLEECISHLEKFLDRYNEEKLIIKISISNNPTFIYNTSTQIKKKKENWTFVQSLLVIMCSHKFAETDNKWSKARDYCSLLFSDNIFHNKDNKQIGDRMKTLNKMIKKDEDEDEDEDENFNKLLQKVMEIYAKKFLSKNKSNQISFREIATFLLNEGITMSQTNERVSEEDFIVKILILLPRPFVNSNLCAAPDSVFMQKEFETAFFKHFFEFIFEQTKQQFLYETKIIVKTTTDDNFEEEDDEEEDNDDPIIDESCTFSIGGKIEKSNMNLRSSLSTHESSRKSTMNLRSRSLCK